MFKFLKDLEFPQLFETSTRSISLFLFNALLHANIVKQFFSSFSASLMVATNSSSNDLLTSKSLRLFKLTLLISDIKELFSWFTSWLTSAYIWICSITWDNELSTYLKIMWFHRVGDNVLSNNFHWQNWSCTHIEIEDFPILKPLSTAACPWLVNIILTK